LAARIGAFEASLRYAKIEPVALRCGEIGGRRRQHLEALGRKPKFELSESCLNSAGAAAPVVQTPFMAAS